MATPNIKQLKRKLTAYQRTSNALRKLRVEEFPVGSVVYLDSKQMHGIIVESHDADLSGVCLLLESDNVWRYSLDQITICRIKQNRWPTWIAERKAKIDRDKKGIES